MNRKYNELTLACLPPDRADVFLLLESVPDKNLSENELVRVVMRHFRGKANPIMVREIVAEWDSNRTL